MRLAIPYLDKTFPLEFPDENLLALAQPNECTPPGTPEKILEAALANPLGPDKNSPSFPCSKSFLGLTDFLGSENRVLVIINDATRPTPTALMLQSLAPFLEKANPKKLCLLVATGAHRKTQEEEYHQILGGLYERFRPYCLCHDSRKDEDMVDLGNTRNGTPILLSKHLFEADRIIVTGSVEPHYFAGFTGGRKAFLPGIAAYKTVEANHKQALSPKAKSLALAGNPVHEDMTDALSLIQTPVFSVMTVLDKEQKIAAARAGDIVSSFEAAVEIARKIFCVCVPSLADIVVSVAKFPMDIDLYQSQKALDNGGCALADGGSLILVSSCRDGIGDEAYAELLAQAENPKDALLRITQGYKLGYHKAAKMAELSARASVQAVSELPAQRLKNLFIEKFSTPQEALDHALAQAKKRGIPKPKILILPDGCVTVPDVRARRF